MARPRHRLSAANVRNVKTPGRYADGGNLYLVVDQYGKRWVFLYKRDGRQREMGLGSLADVSLAMARERAEAARAGLVRGEDPLGQRRAEAKRRTFGEVADDLIETLRPSWRNEKHGSQWVMTLTVYAAPLRDLPIGSTAPRSAPPALTHCNPCAEIARFHEGI